MAKYMYVVSEGKHQCDDGTFWRAGEPAREMEEDEAKKFPNKFKLVTRPASVEEAEEAPAT